MFKFYLNGQEYTPINIGDLTMDIALVTDSGAYYYEYLLNGSPMFSGKAYEFIKRHSLGQKIEFVITETIEISTYEVFNGKFTRRACTDYKASSRIECEIVQDSLYRRLIDNYDKTFNMLQTSNVVSAKYESTGRYQYKTLRNNPLPSPPPFFYAVGSSLNGAPIGSPYTGFALYAQELKTTYCQGGEPQKPTGDDWELYIDNCEGKGVSTWSRLPRIFLNPFLPVENFYQNTRLPLDPPVIPPVTSANEDWQLIVSTDFPNAFSVDFWINYNAIRQDPIELNNGRLLVDVINFGLNQDVPELDVQSQFLTQDTNPVSLETPSTTKDIQIHAISDIKDPNASEPATREDIRLRDLLEGYVNGKLNCYWRVDERTKRLIIENYKDLFSQGVVDVSNDQRSNTVSYDNTDIPRSEEFPSADSSIDFTGVPIEYDNEVATGVKSYITDKSYSEVESIINDPDSYPKDGFVAITKDSLVVTDPLAENGKITGDYAPNMPQSMGTLHSKFFRFYRPFGSGIMNFQNVSFAENKPIIKPLEIDKKLCNFYFFDPYSEFIGNGFTKGSLRTASFSFKTNRIKLNIQYNE